MGIERDRHPEDWVGETLHGKWRLDELIGVGGVAAVYAATDRSGERVAVKLMLPHWADEPTVRERFLREGYAANRVRHPAVISAQADGETAEGLLFLVLEYLEGRSLATELQLRGKLPEAQVAAIADQLLEAMDAAHTCGVLHRDLKPDNLLLLADGSLRVLDFGIARLQEEQADHDPRLTQQGRAMGTLGFMAPEQARGDWSSVDPRADLWSAGATLFALLTGREVHESKRMQELLIKAMTQPAPPLRDVEPSISMPLARVIDRALAYRPSDRWESAAAMREALQAALPFVQTSSSSVEEAPCSFRPVSTEPNAISVSPSWQGRAGKALVAAAALALLVVGGQFAQRYSATAAGEAHVAESSLAHHAAVQRDALQTHARALQKRTAHTEIIDLDD